MKYLALIYGDESAYADATPEQIGAHKRLVEQAVKPAIDCATRTRLRRPPIASTTASAYSARPAASSSTGRSGATTSWPRASSRGATRCQYQPLEPAPVTLS